VGIPYFSISARGGDEIFSLTPLSLASTCDFITSSLALMVISFSSSSFFLLMERIREIDQIAKQHKFFRLLAK